MKKILLFPFCVFLLFFPYLVFGATETVDFETDIGYTVTKGVFNRVTTEKYEGNYSIESGNRKRNSQSCFEIRKNFSTEVLLQFSYKVSSEKNYDFLRFYLDNVEKNKWSGETDWSIETQGIPAGEHALKWCYTKDWFVDANQDRAWVDIIKMQGQEEKSALNFENIGGYIISTNVVSGNDDWKRVTTEKYEGEYSLESQNRTNSTTACFERTEDVPINAKKIQFYYKVSSEFNYDFLHFSIDGKKQAEWSGLIDWTQAQFPITSGKHTFRWCYQKDNLLANWQDRAWVDAVSIISVEQDTVTLSEIIPVSSPGNDATPDYTFYASSGGVIRYGGSCSSTTTTAVMGNNTITFNALPDGDYNNCTLQIGTSNLLPVSAFQIDTTPPQVNYTFPTTNNSIFPNVDFTTTFHHLDTMSGINTNSASLQIQKWNGVSWGADISSSVLSGSTVSSTGAIYPLSALGFGKYKFIYTLSDNAGNQQLKNSIVYIDEPEVMISTGSLDLGLLNANNLSSSEQEITVTVKSVGAQFGIELLKETDFSDGVGNIIIDWDGFTGVGYDTSPYTSINKNFTPSQVVFSQAKNINTNGEKNTYTIPLKIGTLISPEQAAGEYEMNIGIRGRFTY